MARKLIATSLTLVCFAGALLIVRFEEPDFVYLNPLVRLPPGPTFVVLLKPIAAILLPIVSLAISYLFRRADLLNDGSIIKRFRWNFLLMMFGYILVIGLIFFGNGSPDGFGALAFYTVFLPIYLFASFITSVLSLRIALAKGMSAK